MMDFKTLREEWRKDSQLNEDDLDLELMRIPNLHSKYNDELSEIRLRLIQKRSERKKLLLHKTKHLRGLMTKEELEEHNLEPQLLKVLRQDEDLFLDADKELLDLNNLIEFYETQYAFVENVLKQLNTRGYNIKAAIDWRKFTSGQ